MNFDTELDLSQLDSQVSSQLNSQLSNVTFFDDEADMAMLYALTDQLASLPNARDAVPTIFAFMETHYDKELGNPGPLVHFIEQQADYHDVLRASVGRTPTELTVSMVNRLINGSHGSERDVWIQCLEGVVDNAQADSIARDEAASFLAYQRSE